MNKSLGAHRCAVCWDEQSNHDDWFKHASEVHGAVLLEFGYDKCRPTGCPGVEHAKRLPNFGSIAQRRAKPVGPYKARDGTTYTPQPLFPEGHVA